MAEDGADSGDARDWEVVVDLGAIVIAVNPSARSADQGWWDCRIAATSSPFSGEVTTIFTTADLDAFASSLTSLGEQGEAILGGGRAAEVRFVQEPQIGGTPGLLAIECSVTPSGDDPYPRLTFLIFDVRPFAERAAARVHQVLARSAEQE
ncbi:MAG TPA: hypothetical protein VNO51_12760 [Ilumatobacteraceae bacterium]|nr:hypothetical protein [Ilumatobacteraceae bacterium]